MDRLTGSVSTGSMTTTTHPQPAPATAATGNPVRDVPADVVRKALATRSYAVLATVSPAK